MSEVAMRILQRREIRQRYRAWLRQPTEAQREAGNYRKEHVRIQGLDISIENAKGTRRKPEWPPLSADYGYIRRTEGADGDHVDCFVGPCQECELVIVIDQSDEDGNFDEHKCLVGWTNQAEAVESYLENYPKGWRVGPVTAMTIGQFKAWLADGNTHEPVAEQVARYQKSWQKDAANATVCLDV